MSFWAVNWAAEVAVPSMSEKLLLLLLANFADENDEAWPSIDRLMSMTSASKATIHRLLASLEERGLISREESRRRTAHGNGFVKGTAIIQLMVPDHVVRRPSSASGARPTPASGKTPSRWQSLTGETLTPRDGSPIGQVIERPGQAQSLAGETLTDQELWSTDLLSEGPCQAQSLVGETLTRDEGVSGLTGETGRVSLVRLPPTPPYKEEPPLEPPDLTNLPASSDDGAGPVFGGRPVGSAGDHDAKAASSGDWELLRSCLPEAMQALDAAMAAKVARLLRERLDAGWPARLIRDTLNGNALPLNVHSLGALVAHRVSNIPVDAAPAIAPALPRLAADPAAGPDFHPAFRVERLRATLTGAPEAGQPALWWAEKYRGPSRIPIDVDLESALRAELAATPALFEPDEPIATSPTSSLSPLPGT